MQSGHDTLAYLYHRENRIIWKSDFIWGNGYKNCYKCYKMDWCVFTILTKTSDSIFLKRIKTTFTWSFWVHLFDKWRTNFSCFFFFHKNPSVISLQSTFSHTVRPNFPKNPESLKVVSATFFLVCFVYLKENTYETRKSVFYFTSKTLFILEIVKFYLFRYSNDMTSSMPKHETRNTYYWKTWEVNIVW